MKTKCLFFAAALFLLASHEGLGADKENPKQVSNPIYAHPSIIVHPQNKLRFIAEDAGIKKEFPLSELNAFMKSLPYSVWEHGITIDLWRLSGASEEDSRRMDQNLEKVYKSLVNSGFLIQRMPSHD